MKTSIILLFIFLLVITTCFTVFGQQKREQALIVYLEGEVNVHRDEAVLEGGDVDIGFELETRDLLETGGDGLAEIELNSPGQEGTILSVLPETAFYFTADIESGIRKTWLEMMKGSMGVKVTKVFNYGEVVVSTWSVVVGVRGTDFTIIAAADGSLLITCTEGRVSCTDQRVHGTPRSGR